jgi:hypothetical protein
VPGRVVTQVSYSSRGIRKQQQHQQQKQKQSKVMLTLWSAQAAGGQPAGMVDTNKYVSLQHDVCCHTPSIGRQLPQTCRWHPHALESSPPPVTLPTTTQSPQKSPLQATSTHPWPRPPAMR